MSSVFLYGPLLDTALRCLVLGEDPPVAPAKLKGYDLHPSGDGETVLVPGDATDGLVVELGDAARDRLDCYERARGAVPDTMTVNTGQPVRAAVYSGAGEPDAAAWSLPAWQARWGRIARKTASEILSWGGVDPAEARFRLPMARMRAHSACRAEDAPAPQTLGRGFGHDEIEVLARRRPYVHFFALDEVDLRHPHFDGSRSETLNRAGLVSGDAVTVLPYDPVRDRVLVVEQFRMGLYLRGDPHPWAIEPVAGRIDPGETAETAIRREAREEAAIEIGALHPVSSYYPSPGVLSEYLDSFVGIADLPDPTAGVAGAAEEGEDIRSHILPFDRLMELIDTGEIRTGPLILTALWLERARNRTALT